MPTAPRRLELPDDRQGPPKTKRDRIVMELRRMINDGEFPRGSKMQQDVLAARFETSITPVREALRLLEAEGLLVSMPHRGVRVADADYESAKTVYLLRRLIEPYAMRRAVVRLSRRDLDLAERLVTEMEDAAEAGDRATLNEINYDFHFLFYNKVGNDGLTAEIRALWKQFPWDLLQVVEQRARHTSVEHRQILNAARAGDARLIARCTDEHLARSFHGLALHLTGEDVPDPFDPDND
jgi:DNA-binding GntR family transcriptional regulator